MVGANLHTTWIAPFSPTYELKKLPKLFAVGFSQ